MCLFIFVHTTLKEAIFEGEKEKESESAVVSFGLMVFLGPSGHNWRRCHSNKASQVMKPQSGLRYRRLSLSETSLTPTVIKKRGREDGGERREI